MNKRSIKDADLSGKRVLTRVDFNVPLNDRQEITDDTRIVSALPTIRMMLEKGAAVILMSHLGRPKGEVKKEMSLKPVAEKLSALLDQDVRFAPDCVGDDVRRLADELEPGDVMLLENLRFHGGETKNDAAFAKQLAELGDIFVNDAFGTAHRAHASTEGVTHHISPCLAGLLMEKEIDYLGRAVEDPEHPYVAILGGAKISGKIDVTANLLEKVDTLLIGGGMTYTFLKAQGMEIGNSLVEEDKIAMARQLMQMAELRHKQLLLPIDTIVGKSFDNDTEFHTVRVGDIPMDMMGLDIGPATIDLFKEHIVSAKTIVWNGPMGVFEMPNFARGTVAVAKALAEATDNGAVTVVGGGDSAAAINKFGLRDKVTHVSTGGGASLELLEGKTLPGLEALTDKE